ncbi:MAG: LytR C-terminal domain-containing protein [Acidimicrobiales bacterium]
MNSATRGVVLAVFAVLLGVIILGRGFDDPTVATGDPSPTAAPSDDGGTDVPADDGSADASAADDSTTETPAEDGTAEDGTAEDGTAEDGTAEDGTAEDGTADTPAADGSAGEGTPGGQVKPPAEVRVLVANDTTVGGLAGTVTNTLTAEGYATLTPTNTTTQGADAAAPSVVYFGQGYRPDAIAVAGLLGLDETSVAQMPETPPVDDLGRANLLVVVGANLVPAA